MTDKVHKQLIIDEFDEEVPDFEDGGLSSSSLSNRNYLKDRRVTTVEEQQTWEDMEDDEYPNYQNFPQNLVDSSANSSPNQKIVLGSHRETRIELT